MSNDFDSVVQQPLRSSADQDDDPTAQQREQQAEQEKRNNGDEKSEWPNANNVLSIKLGFN